MRLELLGCFAVLAAACGPPGDSGALLLLDAEARGAGLTLSVGGWSGSPHLPISVREDEHVVVAGGFGSRVLQLRAGHLGLVVGTAGSVDWRKLGDEVDADALELVGEEQPVRDVATTLGASVTGAGERRWMLRAPELVQQSAWMSAGKGLDEVHSVPLLALRSLDAAAFPTLRAPGATVLLNDVVQWVGMYRSKEETLVLDASGGFRLDGPHCESSSGTYRVEGGEVVLVPTAGAPRRLEGFTPLEVAP